MAELIRIGRKRKSSNSDAGPVEVVAPTEDQQTMLGTLGGAAGSGLHRIGSALSATSRLLHGSINAGLDSALGTDTGGFGNLNPLDSTGGFEGSKHLERAGLLAKNDPNKWEWRDPLAGAADIAMDPLTYAWGVGLAQRGIKGLSKMTGVTDKVVKPAIGMAKKSFPVRAWRGNMSAPVQGVMDADLQDLMVPNFGVKQHAKNKAAEMAVRWGMEQKAAGFDDKTLREVMEGVKAPSAISDPVQRAALTRLKSEYDVVRAKGFDELKERGTGYSAPLADTLPSGKQLEHFPRRRSRGSGDVSETFATSGINDSKVRKKLFKGVEGGTARLNEILHDTAKAAKSMGSHKDVADYIRKNYGSEIAKSFKDSKGKNIDRHNLLGHYVFKNKGFLSGVDGTRPNYLFGNSPIDDMAGAVERTLTRKANADTLAASVAKIATKDAPKDAAGNPVGVSIRSLLKGLKYRDKEKVGKGFIDHVADTHATELLKRTGIDLKATPDAAKNLLDMYVTKKQAEELKLLSPRFSAPAAMNETTNAFRRGMSGWKAYTLAFPASRMRDAVSGYLQNALHGFGLPGRSGIKDAARLLRGDVVLNDYSHVPEVQRFFAKTGINPLTATKQDQTNALRQIVAVHAPAEHSIIADMPSASVGSQLDDVLHNVPGQKKEKTFDQLIGDPMRALMGKDGATWTKPISGVRGLAAEPLKHSTMAPIKASEIFSGNIDRLNRTAPLIEGLRRGKLAGQRFQDAAGNARAPMAHEIADAINRAQVNYDPATYTAFEKGLKSYLVPFYSFQSRMLPETAKQLVNTTSNTSKLARVVDKMGVNSPAVPDYVNESYSVPMGRTNDGSLRYLTGTGLMHEPSTKIIGNAIGGNARGLLYEGLKSLNPLFGKPIEAGLGKSFWRDGQPTSELDSTTGRLAANIGELTGLRPAPTEPGAFNEAVKYPGRDAVDFMLSMTPGDRYLKTATQLTDTRRGPGEVAMHAGDKGRTSFDNAASLGVGLAPIMSGVRVTDISPKVQMRTLRKRAEQLAKDNDAHEITRVLFTKKEIQQLLESDDPKDRALGEKQQAIQQYVNSLQSAKPTGIRRRKKTGIRLQKE